MSTGERVAPALVVCNKSLLPGPCERASTSLKLDLRIDRIVVRPSTRGVPLVVARKARHTTMANNFGISGMTNAQWACLDEDKVDVVLGSEGPAPTSTLLKLPLGTAPVHGVEVSHEDGWCVELRRAFLHLVSCQPDGLLRELDVVLVLHGVETPDAELRGPPLQHRPAHAPAARDLHLFGPLVAPVATVEVIAAPVMNLPPRVG
mmetsp:Transcript_123382/g.343652  ORF Transcript_123382/g.343652 Transcript_123382/m.343652 type:complete len:205 (+) Transcript_123382:65-679(+)